MSSASEAVAVPASEAAVLSWLGTMTGLPYLAVDAFLANLHSYHNTFDQKHRQIIQETRTATPLVAIDLLTLERSQPHSDSCVS